MGIPSTSNTGDQVRAGQRTWATRASSWFSTELDLLLLWSCVYLACLFPLEGPNSPSSTVSIGIFFLRSGLGWVLAQDQQESEEEEGEDLQEVWTYSYP